MALAPNPSTERHAEHHAGLRPPRARWRDHRPVAARNAQIDARRMPWRSVPQPRGHVCLRAPPDLPAPQAILDRTQDLARAERSAGYAVALAQASAPLA